MSALPSPSTPTLAAIYAAYEADQGDGFREHLGASLIGKPCERALWYDFRWITPSRFEGRILRLFDTGNREEARLVRDLRATGATVLEVDPQTGRQFRVEAHGGHFGGSLDAVAVGILEAPKTWHVIEFKTHATKSFRELIAKGVRAAKPQHWAQMQVYMHLTGITRALYMAVCKETDALHIERSEADRDEGERLLARAARVIDAYRPPWRISEDPAWFECRFCSHHPVCHLGAAPALTCRSCLHACPVETGWRCDRHGQMLDAAAQRAGCARHLFIPELIAGDILEAGEDYVAYRLKDGSCWTNDARSSESAAC